MTLNAASRAGAHDPGIAGVSEPARILLVPGSTRAASANTAALRTRRAVAITSAPAWADPEQPRPASPRRGARSFW